MANKGINLTIALLMLTYIGQASALFFITCHAPTDLSVSTHVMAMPPIGPDQTIGAKQCRVKNCHCDDFVCDVSLVIAAVELGSISLAVGTKINYLISGWLNAERHVLYRPPI